MSAVAGELDAACGAVKLAMGGEDILPPPPLRPPPPPDLPADDDAVDADAIAAPVPDLVVAAFGSLGGVHSPRSFHMVELELGNQFVLVKAKCD
ncbi:MAG: hypothetical protein V4568_04875 [Pseudomonadota bacterium]